MLNEAIESRIAALGGLIPVREAFAPLDEEDLAEIEGLFGRPLPALYRRFASKYGRSMFANMVECALPEPSVTNVRAFYVGVFYGGGEDVDANHFKRAIKVFCYRMPPTLLPIADATYPHGQVCLGVSGDEYGNVYFWDQAGGWEGEAADYEDQGKAFPEAMKFQNVTLLADSFSAFFSRLTVIEE